MRIVSCNPRRDQGPRRPAAVLRLPGRRPLAAGTRTGPSTARARGELHAGFDAFCRERGAPPLPELEFIHESPWLNLYLYPDEVDYARARRRSASAGTTCRPACATTDAAWELPEPLAAGDGPLVYLSLGSLGSADVELMRG